MGHSFGLLLSAQDFALHLVGQAESPLFGDGLRILIEHHGTEDRFSGPAAERSIGLHAVIHRAQHLVDEDSLELFGGPVGLLRGLRSRQRGICFRRKQRLRKLKIRRAHPMTWISACSAPAALIACRIEIMSRGPTPRAFNPLTSTCRLTPSCSTMSWRPICSSTSISVRGTT